MSSPTNSDMREPEDSPHDISPHALFAFVLRQVTAVKLESYYMVTVRESGLVPG